MKSLSQHINEAIFKTKNRASDFSIGDKIVYKFTDAKTGKKQIIQGSVVDHFDDGLVIHLNSSLTYFDEVAHKRNQGNYNYQEYTSKISTKSLELYDDEDNQYGNLDNLFKQ